VDWLNTEVYGNSPLQWGLALAVFVGLLLGLRLLKSLLLRGAGKLSQRTETKWDDIIVSSLSRTQGLFLFILALYAGSGLLQLPAPFEGLARKAAIIAFLLQLALWLDAFAVALIAHLVQTQTREDASSVAMVTVIGFIGRVAVWSIMLLMALDNLGFDITALVAGLGIGGIAVALAAQNVLGDLFASVSIVFDQPFVVGDFIIVGDLMGTVEYIGIKTTRVRSLSGEQLVIANNDLLGSRIRNFKRMYERRVVFTFGVVYETPADELEAIPPLVRDIVQKQTRTRFDRAHFQKFGDYALIFEVVYYVASPDYNLYMDIQQAINLAIYRSLEERGIALAYPTQRLYVHQA
jgi:small-conductance mechanosensitive channel